MRSERDEENEQMIKDCEARESRLNDWERSFIDDVGRRLADGKSLHPNTESRLVAIWEKATENG